MAYYPYTLSKTFGSDEYQAGGTEGVDDYEVDPQLIRNSDLTYMGRNDAGNRIWEDEQGHQYVAGQLAKRNPDGTPKRSGGANDDATGNNSNSYGYDPNFTGPNAAQAQLDKLNARLSSRSPVVSSRSVTAKDPLSRISLPHAPLMDFGDYDDIPQTAGIGKFSKQNIKKTALSLPCVAQARAQGKNVTLDMDYSVNGKKVRDTMLIPPVPGSARAAGDLTPDGPAVRFFGSLNSDGSQAAGQRAGFTSSCGSASGALEQRHGDCDCSSQNNSNNTSNDNLSNVAISPSGGGPGGTGGSGGGSGADTPGGGKAPGEAPDYAPSNDNAPDSSSGSGSVTDSSAVTGRQPQQLVQIETQGLRRLPVDNKITNLKPRILPKNPVTNTDPVRNTKNNISKPSVSSYKWHMDTTPNNVGAVGTTLPVPTYNSGSQNKPNSDTKVQQQLQKIGLNIWGSSSGNDNLFPKLSPNGTLLGTFDFKGWMDLLDLISLASKQPEFEAEQPGVDEVVEHLNSYPEKINAIKEEDEYQNRQKEAKAAQREKQEEQKKISEDQRKAAEDQRKRIEEERRRIIEESYRHKAVKNSAKLTTKQNKNPPEIITQKNKNGDVVSLQVKIRDDRGRYYDTSNLKQLLKEEIPKRQWRLFEIDK